MCRIESATQPDIEVRERKVEETESQWYAFDNMSYNYHFTFVTRFETVLLFLVSLRAFISPLRNFVLSVWALETNSCESD